MVKAVRAMDGMCGFCITQLTDVEQEINGLLDFDRKPKADFEKLKEDAIKYKGGKCQICGYDK